MTRGDLRNTWKNREPEPSLSFQLKDKIKAFSKIKKKKKEATLTKLGVEREDVICIDCKLNKLHKPSL